jgi:hypothetical protein
MQDRFASRSFHVAVGAVICMFSISNTQLVLFMGAFNCASRDSVASRSVHPDSIKTQSVQCL